MKIVRVDEAIPSPVRQKKPVAPKHLKPGRWWGIIKWLFLAGLLLAAFGGGALAYRAGLLQPLAQLAREKLKEGPLSLVPEPVKEMGKNVSDEVRMYVDNDLPTLYIDLKFEDYQTLLNKREEALRIGILNTTDADFVDATVQVTGSEKLDAKMRLKGDWSDHLKDDKWSFRIHLKEDGHVLHARQFSIQSPDTRNYLYEWAFHKNLMQEGVLTTQYDFMNVLMNGKLLGIYAFEENFTVELMEAQGRRQGLILRLDEDLMWQNLTTFWSENVVQEGQFMVTGAWSADITAFQSSKIAENPTLAAEAETARSMLRAFQTGERPASEVFDVDLWGKFYALHDLWSACHGVAWHNLRFYYNPVTGLLEPVAFDAEPMRWCDPKLSIIGEFIDTRLFDDPEIRAAYTRELERMTRRGYLEAIQKQLSEDEKRFQKALKVEFAQVDLSIDWNLLKERRQGLSLELQPAQPVRGYYQASHLQPGADKKPTLTLDLVNLMVLPVEVDRVEINGKTLPFNEGRITLPPVKTLNEQIFEPVQVTVNLAGDEGLDNVDPELRPEVVAVARLSGLEREFRAPLTGSNAPEGLQVGPAPLQPSHQDVLRQHPFLSSSPATPDIFLVEQGSWDVQGDLIMPDNTDLVIPAGTVLRFSQGSILYTNGSVNMLGTANAPVLLTAQNENWGGIVVIRAERKSQWSYAAVEKTAGIERGGWVMTGGINFYQANIVLDHAFIGNNQTEDAINVINANFIFRDTEFANTFADAFDSDFSTGEIVNCYFHDITGDAADFSGSTVSISDTRMERITDKAVSVGEKSTVTIQNVRMDTVSIGVASKDLSKATILQSEIRGARFAALAAYIKKPVYGPAQIEAPDLVILDTETEAIAQTGSSILLRGELVETVDMDVDRLYSEGILGN